jgi:branched-chain amino acid transport system permease protein
VTNLLDHTLLGLPYGCLYALMAVGLVVTFRTTGVFNLAFGAQAFLAAFAYDMLNQVEGLPQWAAFICAVLVLSPAVGYALDRFLYRFIPTASMTVKMVTSLGLLLAIPEIIPIIFGSHTRYPVSYVWLSGSHVYWHLGNSPINGQQISTVVIAVAVMVFLIVMFRWSPIGLDMRAVVESRRLSQLNGVNSPRVEAVAWALSSTVAGLAGVLLLPILGSLDPTSPYSFIALLLAGLTAAAIASMRSIPVAALAGICIGVVEYVLQSQLPTTGIWATGFIPSFPFVLLVIVLLSNRALRTLDQNSDPLSSVDPPPPPPAVTIRDPRLEPIMKWGFRILIVGFLISCFTWVPQQTWLFNLTIGLTYSVIFLSITLITGMSGQLSLCQASFAAMGAFTAGQLADHYNFPVLIGSLLGAIVAAAVGMAVALLVSRVSGLLLTLVTLTFAIFCDYVLFEFSWTGGAVSSTGVSGVSVPRPQIGSISLLGARGIFVLAFIILLICILLVKLVQRGTTGRFLAAMRGSPTAASSLGINLTRSKVTVFALSAGIAGIGGALLAMVLQSQVTGGATGSSTFYYIWSLAWVVVVITTGSRSVEGAVQAGMGFAIISYLLTLAPSSWNLANLNIVLFAIGAFTYAAHPEGILEYQKSQWMRRTSRVLNAWDGRRARPSGPVPPQPREEDRTREQPRQAVVTPAVSSVREAYGA